MITPIHIEKNKLRKGEAFFIYKIAHCHFYQTGLICSLALDKTSSIKIHPHEHTLHSKEKKYLLQLKNQKKHINPIILTYKKTLTLEQLIYVLTQSAPNKVFHTNNNVVHSVWKINNKNFIDLIKREYNKINHFYIADGHHRYSAFKKIKRNLEDNYLNSFIVPDNQINILPFHRIVKTNKKIDEIFIYHRLKKLFFIKLSIHAFQPKNKNEFGLYVNHIWFALTLKKKYFEQLTSLQQVGTNIFESHILSVLFKPEEYQVEYIGGEEELSFFQHKVDIEKYAVGFSFAPVSVEDFFEHAGSGNLLPPHSTYFFPKPHENIMSYCVD